MPETGGMFIPGYDWSFCGFDIYCGFGFGFGMTGLTGFTSSCGICIACVGVLGLTGFTGFTSPSDIGILLSFVLDLK